jgi:hypothetical protein
MKVVSTLVVTVALESAKRGFEHLKEIAKLDKSDVNEMIIQRRIDDMNFYIALINDCSTDTETFYITTAETAEGVA